MSKRNVKLISPALRKTSFRVFYWLIQDATVNQDLGRIPRWDFDKVDESILPYLAEELLLHEDRGWNILDEQTAVAIDNNDDDEVARLAQRKRNFLKQAVSLHRLAGTRKALKDVVRFLGFGEIAITENPPLVYDGSWLYDENKTYSGKRWGDIIVTFNTPPPDKQLNQIQRLLNAWKRASTHVIISKASN